jgi:beta-lactamase class D
MKNVVCFAVFVFTIFALSCSRNNIHERNSWKTIYKKYGVDSAGFEILEQSKERIFLYRKDIVSNRYCPASTFKIFLSLVALHTGVAPSEEMIIKWDGVKRKQNWDKDMNLREAFISSSEPYYWELAKRIGQPALQKWLDSTRYGNKKIGPVLEKCWTDGSLQITPDEQVGFLKKLYFDQLPFDKRSQRLVRSIMLRETTEKYKLYYKSGTEMASIGYNTWLVGFVEDSTNHPYFFANHMYWPDSTSDFSVIDSVRVNSTKDIFKELGVIK